MSAILATMLGAIALVGGSRDTITVVPRRPVGPTIEATQLGAKQLSGELVVSRSVRGMDGQLKGGLIGAVVLAVPMMLLTREFNKYSETGSSSVLGVGLLSAALGFIVGVLIAGPPGR